MNWLHATVPNVASCVRIPLMAYTCISSFFILSYVVRGGTAVAQWLRCCATNRKVAASIPDGVIGIFH